MMENDRAIFTCFGWAGGVAALQASVVEGIRGMIQGGGLLIHPDLFAKTNFHLFC
jgi:hypothetical protein